MATSNSPQTLFRFVSLRNPNLTETNKKNLGFIIRPEKMEGVFDKVAQTSNSSTKFQALLVEADKFKIVAIQSEKELEKGEYAKLLNIGKQYVSQDKISAEDLKICSDYYLKIGSNSEIIKNLWDNLIYQYITQANIYVKDSIVFILKALQVGYVQTLTTNEELLKLNGKDFTKTAINANVVLPFEIFEEKIISTNVNANELTARTSSQLKIAIDSQIEQENTVFEQGNISILKSELITIQDRYNKEYQNAYTIALELYNTENAVNIKAYDDQISKIEELEFLKASEAEIKKAYEVLNKYEIPTFKFSFRPELNWQDIFTYLSKESFPLFLTYFSNAKDFFTKAVDFEKAKIKVVSDELLNIDSEKVSFNISGYNDIFNIIDNNTISLSSKLLNDAPLIQDEFASIGGVLIPVISNPTITHLSYILKAYKSSSLFVGTNSGYVALKVQVENASWSVSHAAINAQTSLGAQNEAISTIQVVNNTINFPQFLVNKFRTISSLNIQIYFSNGRETSISLKDVKINTDYTGILVLNAIANGNEASGNETTPVNYFGLKRLGIAEYMKVVQTVHAYVPGEVSNIENVMASELRHKSVTELTRTEETITTSKSQEVEKISDTTKTNRAEMQSETAKEIDRQQSFQAHANFSKDAVWKIDTGTAFATNNAQHISNRQAVTKSQEITERAMERVQSKITEERIMKIIQEVSQTNVHEFDNRGGLGAGRPQHITGVYRWVDKKMKNQIYNYGKRTMFEFMIPEPAKLHRLATETVNTLKPPVDPRKAPAPHTMANVNSVTNVLLEYWAGIYGINLTTFLTNTKQIIHNTSGRPDTDGGFTETSTFQIPENYVAKNGVFIGSSSRNRGGGIQGSRYSTLQCSNLKGALRGDSYRDNVSFSFSEIGLSVSDNVEFQVSGHNVDTYNVRAIINCELSLEYINAWKLENFNAIIKAYQDALQEYKEEKAIIDAELKAKEEEQKDTMGNFYRIIEGDVIKHNCIAYLLQDYTTILGQQFTTGDKMLNFKVLLGDKLDQYTSMAKFLEQAFEWSIMDYTFYSYFWADRNEWQKMYLTENVDALFRSFLQAGMARVIVTVKPGFEEAVQYFLTTKKVWMGGEAPVIGDPLYMSIAQEMKEPTGIPQGKYWITRIPTTLTILQAKSTGLDVVEPLPIFPEGDPTNCENPAELETQTAFQLDDAQLNASERLSTLPKD